jgi:hypothetical protein
VDEALRQHFSICFDSQSVNMRNPPGFLQFPLYFFAHYHLNPNKNPVKEAAIKKYR